MAAEKLPNWDESLAIILQKMVTKEDLNCLANSFKDDLNRLEDKLENRLEKYFDVKLNASDLVLRADFRSEFKGLYLRFNILIGLLTIIATSLVTHVSPSIFNKFFS
jgi:hypothetical protein